MKDWQWEQVHQAVWPYLRADDAVLAPLGAWPTPPGTLYFYRGKVELERASVLILHKGQLAALRRDDLETLWNTWQCIYANKVFVCFARDRRHWIDRRRLHQGGFTRSLKAYLRSDRLKRRPGTVFLLHLPKTAGTSVWQAVGRKVESKLYYDCLEAFLYNPPCPGEFDLVGGHVPLHLLLPHLGPDDHVVGLVRHPTARFRSAFLHSRRDGEDTATLTLEMRSMRETPLCGFLATPTAAMEIRLQLLMLGFNFDQPYEPGLDNTILGEAIQRISRPNALFYPTEDLACFTCRLSRLLGIEAATCEITNAAEQFEQAASMAEFSALEPEVARGNRAEQDLYDHVLKRSCNLSCCRDGTRAT